MDATSPFGGRLQGCRCPPRPCLRIPGTALPRVPQESPPTGLRRPAPSRSPCQGQGPQVGCPRARREPLWDLSVQGKFNSPMSQLLSPALSCSAVTAVWVEETDAPGPLAWDSGESWALRTAWGQRAEGPGLWPALPIGEVIHQVLTEHGGLCQVLEGGDGDRPPPPCGFHRRGHPCSQPGSKEDAQKPRGKSFSEQCQKDLLAKYGPARMERKPPMPPI